MNAQSGVALPPGCMLPDFEGGSILNLMASVRAALGGEARYPRLPVLEAERLGKKLVLLVIDGLGLARLREVAPDGFLARYCLTSLTSVVPSATASAVPVFMTGEPPAVHGFPGWFVWFRELSLTAAILPYATRTGFIPLSDCGVRPIELSGAQPFSQQVPVPVCHVAPRRIADSEFSLDFLGRGTTRRFDDFNGLCEETIAAAGELEVGGFVYSYWPDYDHQCHMSGVDSPAADRHLLRLDESIATLAETLAQQGIDLLVTADHGFTDCPDERQFVLSRDFPGVDECLQFALTGEPRLPIAHLRPGCRERFLAAFEGPLGRYATPVSSEAALAAGWFGPGEIFAPLRDRLGDYLLVMAPNTALFDLQDFQPMPRMRGFHGGLSAEEMQVPLVYYPAR